MNLYLCGASLHFTVSTSREDTKQWFDNVENSGILRRLLKAIGADVGAYVSNE